MEFDCLEVVQEKDNDANMSCNFGCVSYMITWSLIHLHEHHNRLVHNSIFLFYLNLETLHSFKFSSKVFTTVFYFVWLCC